MQAISTVGQLLPAVFQQFCQPFTDFVLKKLLPAKPSAQAKRQKGPSQAAQLKAHAMKVPAASFTHTKGARALHLDGHLL